MAVVETVLNVRSRRRSEMIDITAEVAEALRSSNIKSGDILVFCPHTTAAITINENADPDVQNDILLTLDEMYPKDRSGYRHAEGNSDAHVKSSLFGCSERIAVSQGRMVLGTWQGIYFCEFDGPRNRRVFVQVCER